MVLLMSLYLDATLRIGGSEEKEEDSNIVQIDTQTVVPFTQNTVAANFGQQLCRLTHP